VTFFWPFFCHTASPTNFKRNLLTPGVANKLPISFVNILGGTGGLVPRTALLWALTITNFFQWSVALSDCFSDSFLFESDLTNFFKIFLTSLFLGRFEISNIGIVALLNILMFAL